MKLDNQKRPVDAKTLELRKYRIFCVLIAILFPAYYWPTKSLMGPGTWDSLTIRFAVGVYFAIVFVSSYFNKWIVKQIDSLFILGGCCMTLHLYAVTYNNHLTPTMAWAMTLSLPMMSTMFLTVRAQIFFIITVFISAALASASVVDAQFPVPAFIAINCAIAVLMGAFLIYRLKITDALKLEINRRIEAEKSLKEHQAALLTAAKMTALGEMAGGIAHEINNPLAVIRGHTEIFSSLILRSNLETGQKETFSKRIGTILIAVDRVAKIISGLRAYSRNADNDPIEEVRIQNLLSDVIEFCRTRFSQLGIQLDIKDCDPNLMVKVRPIQISQVILNLINNSFDAVQNMADKWVKIEVSYLEKSIFIRVTDSGPGIPAEVAQKMLDPFFTTKEVGKGQGLGLSVSKGIIESHGGKLEYDVKSTNTSFVINFPLNAMSASKTKVS